MHQRLYRFSLVTATVLLSLTSTIRLPGIPENWAVSAQAQTTQEQRNEALRLTEVGLRQLNTGQFQAALQTFEQALFIFRAIGDRRGEGIALAVLSSNYLYSGNYTKAIEYAQQHLALARKIHDRKMEGGSLLNLGAAYFYLDDYAKAIDYHNQSLVIAREINDRQTEAEALTNLGLDYLNQGNYAKAIDYQNQSLAIAREINDRETEAKALTNLGLAYLNQGNYVQAINYQQQRLLLAKEIRDRRGEGKALGNLGIAYLYLGNYPKSIEYSQQALGITREINDRHGESVCLGVLGNAYLALGNSPKAIEYNEQYLALARKIRSRQGESKALSSLGSAYLNQGDYTKAIEYDQQALIIAREIHDRQTEGNVLGNLGVAYSYLGNSPKAIEYFQQVLAIAREIHDRYSEGNSLNNLGATLLKSGNLAAAESSLMDGIKVWESIREVSGSDANKVSVFEQQARTYRTLQEVLIARSKTDEALEIAERGRARAFVELLAKQISPNPIEQLTIPAPKIEQIKQIAKAQNSTLVQYSIIYDDVQGNGKLPAQESKLYIWIIKPTGEIAFKQVDLKSLKTPLFNLVNSSRASIGVRSRSIIEVRPTEAALQEAKATATQRLQKLHQILIQPIAQFLPTDPNSRVIFIPQESLFLVPFAALQDEQGKYLIEKHTILTAPAIQVLELTHQQRQRIRAQSLAPLQGKDALVMGNPTMPSIPDSTGKLQQLASLPGAEAEAKAIAQLLNTQAITGKDATKAAILRKLTTARIAHLATHGLLDDFKLLGVPGAIALTPEGNDNGLLTSSEILDMKLNAELVVLSACDTGRGTITGDGVIGLSRSLITAGVPSVIVSLWSVPDAPTASLMTQFYQNLKQSSDKAQALRNAMLTTMKQHPDPKDWAAFTLIGEAN